MTEPAGGERTREPRVLSTTFPCGEDLTAEQRRRLEKRAKERRRVTPKALALRVIAIARADREGDLTALVGELENTASACMAWARYIRTTKHR